MLAINTPQHHTTIQEFKTGISYKSLSKRVCVITNDQENKLLKSILCSTIDLIAEMDTLSCLKLSLSLMVTV